jgi:hypothetical protein
MGLPTFRGNPQSNPRSNSSRAISLQRLLRSAGGGADREHAIDFNRCEHTQLPNCEAATVSSVEDSNEDVGPNTS